MQITNRDTEDCFYQYEIPPSRVAKQVIGPRISRSWLAHLNDENWDVVDTDEMESWFSQDLIKTCTSVSEMRSGDEWFCEKCSTGNWWSRTDCRHCSSVMY